MKAIVIYPLLATFQVDVPVERQDTITDVLAYLWEATNPDSGNTTITDLNKHGLRLRSSMVGDIFIVNERQFMIDDVGFVEVDPVIALKIQNMNSGNRLMGYQYFMEVHKYPAPLNRIR